MPWKLEEVRSNQGLRMNEQLFAVVGVPFEHDRKTEYEQHVVLVNLVYSDGVGVTGDHHYPRGLGGWRLRCRRLLSRQSSGLSYSRRSAIERRGS
jgi:hypothetical protein